MYIDWNHLRIKLLLYSDGVKETMNQVIPFCIGIAESFVLVNICLLLTNKCFIWNYKKWAMGK